MSGEQEFPEAMERLSTYMKESGMMSEDRLEAAKKTLSEILEQKGMRDRRREHFEGRTLALVVLACTNGEQVKLQPDTTLYDPWGREIGLAGVREALSCGSVHYLTEVRWEANGDEEPWKEPEPGQWRDALATVYERQVVEVMEVYEDEGTAT